jgi:hypothetical protein
VLQIWFSLLTSEALKKYLKLAPDGEHAREVRQMPEYLAATKTLAENTNKTKKN